MDHDNNLGRQPWSLRSRDAVEEGMNYESSAEDCEFDNRCKRQNRGPYLEDNVENITLLRRQLLIYGNIWAKVKNITSAQLSACLEYYVTDCRHVNPLLAKSS